MNGACPGRTPKLPSLPGTTTISTSAETMSRSGVTNSNWTRSAIIHLKMSPRRLRMPASRRFRRHLAGLVDGLLDRADHVERSLGHLVILAGHVPLELLDRVFEGDEVGGAAGEHFGDVEGLRQEALDLARPRDGQPILFRQFVHAEDRDDVLQGFVR